MAYIEEANELMTDATGQSIATAIGNMSATSVGNLAALQTTDKTSLVGAVNEVKNGLTGIVKTATETITTNANGWIIFPEGRHVLLATIGDYDTVILTYADQYGYMSRYHLMESTTTPQFEMFSNNTEYTLKYWYI